MVTQQNMRVQEVLTESKGFEDRGGVFFDGLTSMLSWEMMELGQRAGKMELKGEEGAIGGKVVSGDLKFGGTTRSHVGFAQTRGEELAHLALGIPHLLVPPVFTALSMEATDEAALSIVGPKIAGRAKTDEAGQWFGNCLETAKVPNLDGGVGEQFVLYLSEFTDGQGRRHLLKHRGAPGTMPEYLADPVGGMAPFSKFNLGLFFKMLDEALTAGIDAAKLIYPDAPGLPEGIEEFGDGGVPEQPQPVQAPAGATPIAEGPQVTTPPVQATQTVQAAPAAPVARGGRKKTTAPPAAVATPSAPVAPPPPTEAQDAATAAPESAGTPVVSLGTGGAPALPAPAVPAPAPPTQATTSQVSAPVAARPVAAPPPGRRPGPPPAAAGAIPPPVANPLAQAPATSAQAPTAAAPRPPAAAPRPPAAAPRPPAAAPPTK
jgi:hypothetical protein